jgi:GrpB-like predicted nucleotidyltransferase (UPF0157 family)
MPSPILIVEYDPAWPVIFEHLRQVYASWLGELVGSIEHTGSTSVPGLAAKPILDIDLVLRAPEDLGEVIRRLSGLGYIHEGDLGIEGREAFKRMDEDVPWDGSGRCWMKHHLYALAEGSRELQRHLVFREALRADPRLVKEYAALKQELAQRFREDREAYTLAKSEFIESVLTRAQGFPN